MTSPVNVEAMRAALLSGTPGGSAYAANEKYQAHLLEQYKLYVEMADRMSARRQTANSYFLTVNTAILSFVGFLSEKGTVDYLWLLGAVGVAISFMWNRLVVSFGDLNTAKYLVVHEIEQHLPLRPYDAEWQAVGEGKNPKLYKPVSHIEAGVPWVFVVLHAYVIWRTTPVWSALKNWLIP